MSSLIRKLSIYITSIILSISPLTISPLVSGSSLILSWNNNEEEDLSGYRLYYGLTSSQYDFMEDVYLDTTVTLSDLDDVTYYFAVTAYDIAGNESDYSEEILWNPNDPVGITDNSGQPPVIPKSFHLSQNYPNPFNPSTTIQYTISEDEGKEAIHTILKVYSLRGQEIKTLVDEAHIPGEYLTHWNGENNNGVRMASGTYLYHLQAGENSSTRKMILGK